MAIGTIFASFFAALGQMADRRFARVFWLGVGLTLALLIGPARVYSRFSNTSSAQASPCRSSVRLLGSETSSHGQASA